MILTDTRQLSRAHIVSVVIAVYNEERDILNVIAEVEKQTYPDYEILVIDDGSTDDTVKLAAEHFGDRENARVVKSEHRGAAHAYNVGINEAKGDVVFIAEGDCVYDADYLEQAIRALDTSPDANAVCLTGGPLLVKSTLATECILLENAMQHQLLKTGRIKPFYAWVFRKNAIEKVGGYDERLHQAEDKDLFKRFTQAGNKVALVPGIHWRHKRSQSMVQLAQKSLERGRSRSLFVLKHRMILDLLRKMGPLWGLVAVPVVGIFSPIAALLLLLLVIVLVTARTANLVITTWQVVNKKRYYLGYPIFLLSRNLATGLGYTLGIFMVLVRKMKGQEVTWQNV